MVIQQERLQQFKIMSRHHQFKDTIKTFTSNLALAYIKVQGTVTTHASQLWLSSYKTQYKILEKEVGGWRSSYGSQLLTIKI